MEAVVCPNCRAALPSLAQCGQCGAQFGQDAGTPVLIDESSVGTISFKFSQRRSAKTDHEHQQYIRYPEVVEGKLDAPYHLDSAQAVVLLKQAKGARVLEVGCGGGQMRPWFAKLGIKYVGIDVSKTRVFQWLQEWGGPDVLCDAHFLPFQDGQFDVVYAAAVTEHIACPVRYAQEVYRVLKPGGYFLSNTAFLEPWHDGSHFHISPDGILELLLEAEFEIDAIWPGRGWHAFKAQSVMAFRGPFRAVRFFAWMPMAAYRLQCWTLRLARRITGKAPVRPIIEDSVLAGAFAWIARRP
jgi:SAM-dependent methyltransferase